MVEGIDAKRLERRVVASIDMRLGGTEAYSELPSDYDGPTKLIYNNHVAIFPTQSEAILAAGAAIRIDIGGYREVTLVAPDKGEGITHETVGDWISDDGNPKSYPDAHAD